MSQTLVKSATRAVTAVPVQPRPWLAVGTLCQREWVRFVRQRNRVFGAIGQPIIFWLLFGLGLGSTFRLPGDEASRVSYREYFFPGSLVLILLFTAIFTTISIIEDRREGFLQSVLVAPIPRWSMVLGKVLGGSLIARVEGLVFLALGLTLDLSFTPLSLVAIVLLLAVISLALTSLGFVIAWRMDSTQGFHAIMSVFLMPMWLLSGAFFPVPALSDATNWGQTALSLVMQANPLTYGVAALRQLMYAGANDAPLPPDTPQLLLCWIVTLTFAVVMFALATRIAAQRTTGRFAMSRAVQYWLVLAALLAAFYGSFVLYRHDQETGGAGPAVPIVASAHDAKNKAEDEPPITDFVLTDQDGKPFDSASLKGKIWVGSFFFTNCPAVCWRLNQTLAGLQQADPSSDVRYVSITCDPDNDTPEALSKYAANFKADPKRWTFLTGNLKLIRKIGNDFFKVSVESQTHSDRAFVVDRNGQVRGRFRLTEPQQVEQLKNLIKSVEAEPSVDEAPAAPASAAATDGPADKGA